MDKYIKFETACEEIRKSELLTDNNKDWAIEAIAQAPAIEKEELKSAINGFRGYDENIKAETIEEFAEKFVQKADKTKIIYVADTTIQEQETGWYQISIADFDNLLKEFKKEREK